MVAVLAATPWPTLLHLPFAWVATYVLPGIVFIALAVRSSDVDEQHHKLYVEEFFKHYGYEETDENKAIADEQFNRRDSTPTSTIIVAILLWIYLGVAHFYIFRGHSRSYDSTMSTLKSLWDWVLLFIMIVASMFCSFSLVGAEKKYKSLAPFFRSDATSSGLELPEDENNDLEIGRLKISMQVTIRRVEAYTIESTLLSALAISAFVAICYGSSQTIDASGWLIHEQTECATWMANLCVPSIDLSDLSKHRTYLICVFMLACSTFFMAVLVTRLRFNDGAKDVEEIIGALDLLNEIENRVDREKAKSYTAEIASLLQRASDGMRSLRPTLAFMRIFRDLGITSFVAAAASCGLILGPEVSMGVMLVFLAAFTFSYADRIRHNTSFLRLVDATVLGRLRKAGRS
jgi:hypothetical protein